ncbi:MAG TPA: hypothetical protein VME01_06820, partial [Solirubrobacteraceae bacterium]|nr:hypothetical protein [Solirubrobacteraceae bacterium]
VAAAAAALAVAGCTHVQIRPSTTTTIVHRNATEQVIHTCVNNIYDNGLLPLGPAQQECVQCVVVALGQLGFKTKNVNFTQLIEHVHLTSKQASELNTACNQSDVDD